jgi:hypothetical protein
MQGEIFMLIVLIQLKYTTIYNLAYLSIRICN